MNERSAPAPWIVRTSIALLCLVWGSTWIVIKGGLDDLPPFTSAAARFVLAAALMWGLAAWIGGREGGRAPSLRLSLVLGTTSFGASYGIVYWTETVLPSGVASLLWAVFPMLMAVSGHFYLRTERLRPTHWLGFAAGFAGLSVLFATDLRRLGAEALPAAALMLLSPFSSAVGTSVVKRDGAGVSSLLLNRNAMSVGAALLCLCALAYEDVASVRWSAPAVWSVVYLAVAGTVFTFGLYFWLLRFVDAHRLSLIAYITPLIALALGLLRDEPLTLSTICGAALVLGGVGLVVTRRSLA